MKGKNLLSALLSAMIASGSFGALAMNVPEDVSGTRFEEPVQILRALGIMNGDENGEFRLDDTIIRSEVAKMAVHAMGLESAAESSKGETKFDDVGTDHWANGYINVATAQGLIEGDGDGKFRPNDSITYAEAMAIMVRATGYTPMADDKGGYPTGYISVGSSNGINKNVEGSTNEPITRGNVAYMTSNALDVKLMEKTGFGSSAKYEIVDKTLLNDVLNVTRYEGQITAIENTSLEGSSNLAAGQVKIGDKVYDTAYNMNSLFGHNVVYYVEETRDGEVIILAMPKKSENSTLSVAADNFISVTEKNSNKAIEYYENKNSSTKKTAELSKEAVLIYNGKYEEMDDELLNMTDAAGGITLLDTDRDGKYDIVFVTSFYNMVVEEVTSNGKIVDKYGAPTIQLNDDVEYQITKKGKSVEVSELEEYDVLSIAESRDGELFDVYVTNDKVAGKISSVSENGYYIDGKLYEAAANYTDELAIGLEGTFYLDIEGKIAAVDTTAARSTNYAYLMRAYVNTNEETVQFKLFTKEGKEVVVTANDKIRFNGRSGVKASEVVAELQNEEASATERQLVTYSTNTAGKLTAINTAKDNTATGNADKSSFVMNYKLEDAVYNSATSKLGSVKITDKTIVFNIPDGSDEYSIADKSLFEDEQTYNAVVYDREEDFSAGVVVVTNAEVSAEADAPIAIVKAVGTAVNSEDTVTDNLTAFVDGKEVSLLAEEEGILVKDGEQPLENGDIIQYRTNADGEIVSLRVLFDASEKDTEFTREPADELVTVYGKVTKKFASSINVSVNDGAAANYELNDEVTVYTVDTEKSKNNIEVSTAGDIQAFDEDENNRVFLKIYEDVVREVVIIK